MDPLVVITAMAMEAAFERKRQKIRRMENSLRARQVAVREKVRERAMLMRKKQIMLAKEAAKQKVADDFIVFIDAIERNDMEQAQNFDEEAMMSTILTMMNGDNGAHSVDT